MATYKNSGPSQTDWHRALAYWRKLPSEAFEPEMQDEVLSCVAQMSSTIEEWRMAVAGDAAAAVGIALKLKTPTVITAAVDLTMTLLLRAAFEDAGAALVLSTKLLQMPLPPVDRARLSASWRLHNIYLAWRSSRLTPSGRSSRRQ